MTQIVSPAPPPPPDADPYRYGWRYVRRTAADGTQTWEQVPLTLEDVLHPQEEDFIVNTSAHNRDRAYVRNVFSARRSRWPGAVVLCDVRVDLNIPGVRPLGPDIAVFFGVRDSERVWSTFGVAAEGARPVLLVEITSPETRENDVGIKVEYYHRAGVPLYVIVDRPRPEGPVQLIGYRHTPQRYEPLAPDAEGRLPLAPLGLLLGARGNRVVLYDAATGEELGDYAAITAQRDRAQEARQAAEARAQEEADARQAESRAREEAEARARDAEAQLAELQARLRALEGPRQGPPGTPPSS
jgi:hypothetical protein